MTEATSAPAPIRIGCSGWNYRHWRGAFYPEGLPVKRWFAHYAARFDTVEINNSFYRLPRIETVIGWGAQAPAGFVYAVKANRFITQAKKLKDCAEPVARMMAPVRHFGETLGPILYQLPPNLHCDLSRLEAFLALLPDDLDHVFEFRDASWYSDATLALLDRFGAGFVVHDFPGKATPRWAGGRLAYLRFHGSNGKYHGRYSEATLRDWAAWMRSEAASGRPVWAYFNNDMAGAAPADALALKRLLGQSAGEGG